MSNTVLIPIMIICWGVGSFFYKIANNNIHPIIVSTVITCLYLTLTPLAWIFLKFDKSVNIIGILSALIGGFLVCIASLAYFAALQKGEAGRITILSSMYPIITLLLSMIFLGEPLTMRKAVGILLAGASFYFLSR